MFDKFRWNETSIVGILIILFGLYLTGPNLITTKNSLVPVVGQVANVETNYDWVTSSRGSQSVKSLLTIVIEDNNQEFTIFENVGSSTFNPRFEKLKRKVDLARQITIWIKKSEANSNRPEVFEIRRNEGEVIFSFSEAKKKERILMIGTTLFGLLLISFSASKYGKDNYRLDSYVPSKLVLTLLTLLLLGALGYFVFLGAKYGSVGFVLFFGGIAVIYFVLMLYFVLVKK